MFHCQEMSMLWQIFSSAWSLGKGRLPLAQTLLVVTNMKFGANEISVTFIIKLNVCTTSTQWSLMSPGRFQTYQSKELKKLSKLSIINSSFKLLLVVHLWQENPLLHLTFQAPSCAGDKWPKRPSHARTFPHKSWFSRCFSIQAKNNSPLPFSCTLSGFHGKSFW